MTDKILVANQWQRISGDYLCNHPDILKYDNAYKAFQLIWEKTPIEFMLFIIEKYNAEIKLCKNEDGSIKWYYFSFNDYSKSNRFILDTNLQARNKKFTIKSFLELA